MKILCLLGEYNYGDPKRGKGYEFVNFLPALKKLGHEIVFFESFNRDGYKDFADLNRKLLEKVQTENPDIILSVLLMYEVWIETLQLIREGSDAILINWSTDDSWKYEQFSKLIAKPFHIYATTYPEAVSKSLKDGYNNFQLTQWAANSQSLASIVPSKECKHKVTFVGSSYGNRPKWVAALKEKGVEVECFGYGWNNGSITTEEMSRILRESIIGLNFGDSGWVMKGCIPVKSRQIKARVFEINGAGGFLFTEPSEHLENFYKPNQEIVLFEGIDDLVSKINYYLSHPDERDMIAQKGNDRTRNEHTYEIRFSNILNQAISFQKSNKTSPRIDFKKFQQLEDLHKITPGLHLFQKIFSFPFIMLWGKHRGPRAARRFLFEVSWRIMGQRTYSVKGLPGRLFYKES